MLWAIEIQPKGRDFECERVADEYALLTLEKGTQLISRTAHGYLVEGDLHYADAERLLRDLLVDPLAEIGRVSSLQNANCGLQNDNGRSTIPAVTVVLKPGVMDPAALSVVDAAHDLGIAVASVRTFRRYFFGSEAPAQRARHPVLAKVLANDAIEQIIERPISTKHLALGTPYRFHLVHVPLRDLDDPGLMRLSREGQLSLSLAEMGTIQEHFRGLGREPTDVELETLAQTWSEHCSHKTLKGKIDFDGRHFENLLKETIFAATREIRRQLGADDWCVSVFEDNAGVVQFDDQYHV